MQLIIKDRNTTSPKSRYRRGRLPALLAVGVLFLFVLSACQVAVAEDGSVLIKSETETATGGQPETGNTGAGGSSAGVGVNTFTGLLTQTGEVDPTTVSPIDPNQVYEWNGVIEWVDLEGGHFVIDRDCDNWAVIPQNDELYARLKELHGDKATVWGTVSFDSNIYGRRAINATTVFAPGEIRPLIAVPEIPCNDTPVPGQHIAVNHSEVIVHGELVWRGGRLWLVTPRGNVRLELPQLAMDMFPGMTLPEPDSDSNLSISLGEYGVVGRWDLASTGLVVKVREIREWPVRTFVRNNCGGGFHHFVVGDDQLAARGTLIISDDQWLLRTKSGVVFIHRSAANDSSVGDLETGEATLSAAGAITRTHEVVVIGEWKTDGNELHLAADKFVRVKTACEPPRPPRTPILPGEIAALGTLVFEHGRPFLNTPSGRIVLLTNNDAAGTEPQAIDPSFFADIAPEAVDAAGSSAGEDGQAIPDIARPVRHILVVGKWQILRDNLAIVVRYALPWPYPYPTPTDEQPRPAPMPVPPIFDFPVPLPPVSGAPVEPQFVPARPGQTEPAPGGFDRTFGGDVITPEPDFTRDERLPSEDVNSLKPSAGIPVIAASTEIN